MRKTLVLFTASYPFSIAAENGFLPQEIAVLQRHFDRIVVVPQKVGGDRDVMAYPNVEIDTSYAALGASVAGRVGEGVRSLVHPPLYRELAANAGALFVHQRNLMRVATAQLRASMTARWIRHRLRDVRASDCLLYTWWFDGTTLGLTRFAAPRGIPVITRAHGSDLYAERHDPPYMPFRRRAMDGITRVYSASRAGAEYLSARFPEAADRVRTGLLGVEDPGFANPQSSDGVVRIASCSFLLPVKRIDLMIRAVAEAGRARPQQRSEWTHFGDGPERDALVSLAASEMPSNVTHRLLDYPGKRGLYDFYRSHPIDLFMNTSESEGTPVSTMEAISVGIPVLATAVGGNAEIVSAANGQLVPSNASPAEIAGVITRLAGDRDAIARMRAASREKWRSSYNAATNYSAFAGEIQAL